MEGRDSFKAKRLAYMKQRTAAKARGIAFNLSLDEWIGWWESHLGCNFLEKRGRGMTQLVMARKGDVGAYELGNIKCISQVANLAEACKHPDHVRRMLAGIGPRKSRYDKKPDR
jgi:hypothetical protein